MKIVTFSRFPAAAALAAFLVALPLFHLRVSANSASQPPARAGDGTLSTTLADQSDLALTVYNSNLSLVRDVRQITLPGRNAPAVHGHRRVDQIRRPCISVP
jgi:hypothetical protein